MWLWALKSDGANNVQISPAFSYRAQDPSILEVGLLYAFALHVLYYMTAL